MSQSNEFFVCKPKSMFGDDSNLWAKVDVRINHLKEKSFQLSESLIFTFFRLIYDFMTISLSFSLSYF